MCNDKIVLAFVGEIYNYKDFCGAATSDTEVLMNVLSEEGPQGLSDVDGMYAIVYLDLKTNLLHVITDHLSKKPLYFCQDTGEIASEIKPLLLSHKRKFNLKYFQTVAHLGYYPGWETAFEGIIQIPPNTHMIYHPDTGQSEWYLNFLPMSPLKLDLYEVVETAVRNRLVADVPISFLLSGGLDSSIVCSLAAHIIDPTKMNTFSIRNGRDATYARYLARRLKTNHRLLVPFITDPKPDPEEEIDNAMYYNESPVDLGSMVPQYKLCEAVKRAGFRVVITGDGADELFGGYSRMSKYIDPSADTQYHDVFIELPYYHCPRLDKMSMANTVELRSPFLSRRVIRTALSIPYERRIGKQILKDTFREIIPDCIVSRDKEPLRTDMMRLDRQMFRIERIRRFQRLVQEEHIYDEF